jgi:protein TonB
MSDVLIVCVREDEPQAKALAEMFEAAGFSIGGAPSSDGALRSSGAGLVVWSQASIRSRPFLDAAQRVINAEKAVVASLIEPPPPSSIGDSPVFDLSRWDGDPNDPSLDPLFFAVDRMVNSARAAVGAGAVQDTSSRYDAPPREAPRAPKPPSMAPPQATSYSRPASDPLGSEAEHWRAIRDSRNPSDFMDYLARYGPEGAFSEVAELRLKQLTSHNSERPSAASARPAVGAPRAAPATPSRPMLPPRADAPRRDVPPILRRPEPSRRPPPERGFDRGDLREPPKGEGGPLRAIILIALLGGAALIGGLYFGGGMPNFGGAPQEEQIADAGPPPASYDEPADAPTLDEPTGVPIEDIATPARRPEAAPRRETVEPAPRREERPRREEAPPPVTSWNSANSSPTGGPVSLSPGSTGVPSTTAPPLTASVPTVERAASIRQGSVVWAQRPTARRISELYPERAGRDGVGGRVELDCSVRTNLSLACSVSSESPAGVGFGRAALNAAASYRSRGALSDGNDATGARTRIVVQFQAPTN